MTAYELKRYVDEVEAQLAREEFDFPSAVPVLGPLIRVVRKAWNSISTRWYVQHYAKQQAQFDTAVLCALRMTQYCCEQLAAQTASLSTQIADLGRDSLQRDMDSLWRDEEGLKRDQELSARLYNQAQQVSFAQKLLEKDIQVIVQHTQARYTDPAAR